MIHKKNEMYFFSGSDYVLIDVAPGTTNDKIINGPKPIAGNWPSLEQAGFHRWLDAVIPSPNNNSPSGAKQAYFFSGDQYALIEFTPGTTDEKVVNGPKPIAGNWPSLEQAGFASGVDAALVNPDNKNQVYFFKGSQYVLIEFKPGTTDEKIVNGPKPIAESWPSLVEASKQAAEAGSHADFTAAINGAVLNPANAQEAYVFSGDQSALVTVAPGTTDDKIVNGPKPIKDNWPSLVQANFF